mmetsp:Transcript_9487/g.11022  ORF Transcript_9487/g.11022 Transcript_9487/m.11022 type:complete len:134 (+) Transcript_9487:206-607(+)|eukprot:CAMPEP_0170840934 /NCGR_PEP_ID=MMETSP0734-20130129/4866_1 /TAXON_ID=186038 /ORGANISM="Fragilariopsis kerguelensis, Strain L26-C5" /LENGTH=133 /DNA_ID=CAMNT_0011208823 /DNA_START=340 /DNA_END=744 /DNA_ORIENTATION=-
MTLALASFLKLLFITVLLMLLLVGKNPSNALSTSAASTNRRQVLHSPSLSEQQQRTQQTHLYSSQRKNKHNNNNSLKYRDESHDIHPLDKACEEMMVLPELYGFDDDATGSLSSHLQMWKGWKGKEFHYGHEE